MKQKAQLVPDRPAPVGVMAALLLLAASLLLPVAARAEDVTTAQRRAAAEYLDAVASGSAQAMAFAIHPNELERLRNGILARLRQENTAGDNTVRSRLFGQLASLQDVERLTTMNFFQTIARRGLVARSRPYQELKGLVAVRDGKELVHVLVKGIQPKERGQAQVVEVVSLLPYGKDWKAAIPGDIEAQIEDLMAGRGPIGAGGGGPGSTAGAGGGAGAGGAGAGGAAAGSGAAGAAAAAGGAGAGSGNGGAGSAGNAASRNPPEILAMLGDAERALIDGRCDDYYKQYLSPNFRKTLSSKMLASLISGCRNGIAQREVLIAALRIVRKLPPQFEYDNSRATYDVSGQGLAFDRYVLEKVEGRWYIAE